MEYSYSFYGYGTTKERNLVGEDELWLDLGNTIDATVIDHHGISDSGINSTVSAICSRYSSRYGYEIIKKTLEDVEKNGKLRFGLHIDPDLDSVCSVFLVQKFLEETNKENDYESRWQEVFSKYRELMSYVDELDQGTKSLPEEGRANLFLLSCVYDYRLDKIVDSINKEEKTEEFWKTKNEAKFHILHKCIEQVENEGRSFGPEKIQEVETEWKKEREKFRKYMQTDSSPDSWGVEQQFIDATKNVCEQYLNLEEHIYETEQKSGKVCFTAVKIKDKTYKLAIWHSISDGNLGYYFARQDMSALTFVPLEIKENTLRVMISLGERGEGFPLLLLAQMLVFWRRLMSSLRLIQTVFIGEQCLSLWLKVSENDLSR